MKKRIELIEDLEQILYNINTVEKQANQKIEDSTYYKFFGQGAKEFEHDKEIRTKALAYWIRRFNRTLNELKY